MKKSNSYTNINSKMPHRGKKESPWDKASSDYSKKNRRKDKAEKKPEKVVAAETAEVETSESEEQTKIETPTDLGKANKLVFFKKYYTYQVLFEVTSKTDLTVDECFSKVLLYVMRWFKTRLGDEVFEKYPGMSYIRTDYPEPEEYKNFSPEMAHAIDGLSFLDVEARFYPKKKVWLFSLEEPDNEKEKMNLPNRTFKTEISIYRAGNSVVLGVRESCREPEKNVKDAKVLRPAFVREIFYDADLMIGEQGLDKRYAFMFTPYILNGKSKEKCKEIYEQLIISRYRRLPILFVPEEFYEKNKKGTDEKTVSLLGFGHVVVLSEGSRKLFEQIMADDKLTEASEDGNLIFYKSTGTDVNYSLFDIDTEDVLEMIRSLSHREAVRRYCDFGEYGFELSVDDLIAEKEATDVEKRAAEEKFRIEEVKGLRKQVGDLERDNENLQNQINGLKEEIGAKERLIKQIDTNSDKKDAQLKKNEQQIKALKAQNDSLTENYNDLKENMNNALLSEKERYLPLINLPQFDKDKKENILAWIKTYYDDLIMLHPNAEKSYMDDGRNIDGHKLCMMIHYLAGYTKYRNEGGTAINADAAREYDPENASFKAEPTSTGQGAICNHKNSYTITVDCGDAGKIDEILDLHIKSGKGSDADMIRVYFAYVPELKKSVIGYMPGHLPTRKDSH